MEKSSKQKMADPSTTGPVQPAAASGSKPAAVQSSKPSKEPPKELDLAFCLDTTGSMGRYIQSAQQNIRMIVEKIVAAESADVRFGLVGYRDHPPQESSYVTKVFQFTSSLRDMRTQLNELSADGGGDCPEAVADGLHACLKLEWGKESTKVCVLVADAPPHGLYPQIRDGFPNGCPVGLDPVKIANDMAARGITLYVVGVEPPAVRFRDGFMALATITGGQYVPLSNAALLADVIVGGAQEEMALEQIVKEMQSEPEVQAEESEEVFAQRIHQKMTEQGLQVKRLRISGQDDLPEPTEAAQKMSKAKTLQEAAKHVPKPGPGERHMGLGPMSRAKPKKSKRGGGGPVPESGASSVAIPEPSASAAPQLQVMPMSMAQASRVARKSKARSFMS